MISNKIFGIGTVRSDDEILIFYTFPNITSLNKEVDIFVKKIFHRFVHHYVINIAGRKN